MSQIPSDLFHMERKNLTSLSFVHLKIYLPTHFSLRAFVMSLKFFLQFS